MSVCKDKERGTWYCTIRYTDWSGNSRQHRKRGFARQSEAKAYEREFLSKNSRSANMTFGAMTDIYMEDCKIRLRETTYRNKEYLINARILPFFKALMLDEITPATVRQWQNTLLSSKEEYSQTYLKTVNNQISAILNYAVKYYGLPFNPAARCGSIGKKSADEMSFWTLNEFKTFMLQASSKHASKAMFETLYWTGMREGELLALTLEDIDFASKKISITKTFARVKGRDVIGPPKTPKSKRVVTVPDFLLETIKDYVSRLYDYEPTERLFEYTARYLQWEITRGCTASGVKKIRVHDLRHSHAALLIELGYPVLLISERLGHENIETTLGTYGHLYPNKHIEVAEKLGELNAADFSVEVLPDDQPSTPPSDPQKAAENP